MNNVFQGVTCFHLVPSLHLLATGSADGMVRLFESTQANPFATLTSPGLAAVLDVAIVPAREIVIAYCSNCVSILHGHDNGKRSQLDKDFWIGFALT